MDKKVLWIGLPVYLMGLLLFKSSVSLAIPICTSTQVEEYYASIWPENPEPEKRSESDFEKIVKNGKNLILQRHPQLPKEALAKILSKILKNPSYDGKLRARFFSAKNDSLLKNKLRYRFTPDRRLFVQVDEKVIQEGASKKIIQVFQFFREIWTEAALIVPANKKLIMNDPIAHTQWLQEKRISKYILNLLVTKRNPEKAHGLPRIFYVADGEPRLGRELPPMYEEGDELGGIYEERYNNSLFELFEDPFFLQENLTDRIAVVHQAALALSHFHHLEEIGEKKKKKWLHQDVKPENFLFLNISNGKAECRVIVVTDFSFAQSSQELLDSGQLRWGSASASYVDPAHIFKVESIFDWISEKGHYELNFLGRDPRYIHWYGDSDSEKISNAWATDAYGIGIISLFALYGTESPIISEAFAIKDSKAQANSILGRGKLFYLQMQKRAVEKDSLNTLDDFLRVSLEIDPRLRASVDSIEKALRIYLSPPVVNESPSNEKLSSLSFGPCSEQLAYKSEFEIGDYLICEEDPTLYRLWYRIPSRDNQPLILEKGLPAHLTGEQVRAEIQILIELGVLKKYI